MTLIVCVDDNMGMLFNHRRQSKDVVVRERILKQAEGKHLWMNHYSAKQFDPEALINADESFMNEAARGCLLCRGLFRCPLRAVDR